MHPRLAPPEAVHQHARVPRAMTLPSPVARARSRPRHRLREVRVPLLLACTYYPMARIGELFEIRHTDVTAVWPASGLAVASLLVLGRRHWPALAVAAFLANLTDGLDPALAAATAAGSTAEYVLAATLLRHADVQPDLTRIRDVILFTGLAGLVAPTVAASVGTYSLWLSDVTMTGDFPTVWASWWLADGIGVLVFGSGCLAIWSAWTSGRRPVPGRTEGIGLALTTPVTAGLVFISPTISPSVLFPLAIWAGVRFEQLGAAGVTVVVATVATYATVHGSGRFSVATMGPRLLPLQLYTVSYGLTAMVLAAAITSRRRSDQRLRARSLELEAKNAELEAFTCTVSHDLRAPLRAIHAFSSMVVEEEAPRLSAAGARRLQTVTRNAEHMSRLIDSLLGLAQVGRRRLVRQPVDTARAARAAAGRLHLELEPRPPELVIDAMPGCSADPVLLEQVYENLIGNAVKFTRDRDGARIAVGCRASRDGDPPVYFVKDNGSGFDPRYGRRLFALFERLPQHADVPGIGAGLAIVARIVARHGGTVWAEGRPGEGATFCFTVGTVEVGP
jgi:signal transduction histidine kinase